MVGAKSAAIGILLATGTLAQTFYWNPSPAGGGQIERTLNWTSGANGAGARPPSSRDDAFATIDTNTWKWIDSVPSGQPTSLRSANGRLTLTAAGADVWVGYNQMAALYRTDIIGAFDVTVRVDSQSRADAWSKCGIMAWNNFKNFTLGGGFAVEATPDNGWVVHFDSTDNQTEGVTSKGRFDWPTGPNDPPEVTYPHWLRLVKWVDSSGRWTFTGYYRTSESNTWTKIRGDYHPLLTSDTSQIGLFVTSHNTAMASTAIFDDFRGGSNLQATNYNLSFAGTGASADQNAILGAQVQAASIDFSNYSGNFSFGGWTLSLSGDARFTSTMGGIHPGTGRLSLVGISGVQNLYPRPGDTLPSLHKLAGSEVVVQGAPLIADSLYLAQGIWDMGGQHHHLRQFTAGGGTLEGMGAADDTLFIYDRADFTNVATFTPGLGTVVAKAVGSGKTLAFNPAGKTFRNVTLWTVPTGAGGVNIQVGPGHLVTSGNLIFRNQRAPSGHNGETNFLAHNPNVTVGGGISQLIEGTGTNWHPIRMGNGTWNVAGSMAFTLNGGSADNSVLNLTGAAGTQTLAVTDGTLKTVSHAAGGTVQQTVALSAASLSLTGGTWNTNGQDISLSGNLIVDGPTGTLTGLGGSDLVVLGSAAFTGRSGGRLNLAPASDWTIKVSGAFTADHVDVANSNAFGGTAGSAGANSSDLGRNINWSFNGGPPTSIPVVTGTDPKDSTVMEGAPVSFTAVSTGHSLAYEWRRGGDPAVIGTSATLSFASASLAQDGFLYQCIVSNSSGKDTTREARLTVTRRPVPASVSQEPLDALAEVGRNATFSIVVAGDPTIAYEWRKKGDTTVLSNTASLTLAGLTLGQDDTYYQCIVSNAHGKDTTREAKLDVVPQPVVARILREPRDSTVYVTEKVSFSVAAEGSTPLAFAWRKAGDTAVLSIDSVLSFASATLAQDNGTYQCIVSNGYGADTSRGALLRVLPPPVAPRIVREPSDTLVKAGTRAAFSAGVLGSAPLRYEWRRKGDTALLSTDSLFVIATASEALSGNSYYVIVSNNTPDRDTSAEARLTVRACDSLSIQTAGDTAVEEGKNVAVWGKAVCADRFEWSVVSGPAPRLLDPGVDTLAFRAPRVAGDTAILYRFTAFFGDVTEAKDVRVGLKEAIPDPDMALPADLKWSGDKPLALRPQVYNQAQLDLFTGYPLRYAWSLEPLGADTAQAGDSLILRDPLGEGVLSAVLCMDNGGAADCDTVRVTVQPIPTALAPNGPAGMALPGGLRLLGTRLAWTAPGTARIWDWRGRLLFEARGMPGSARDLSQDALRALLGRRARLTFRP